MTDIGLFIDEEDGSIDLKVGDSGLIGDDGLETAVLIALFTDLRVASAEIPSGQIGRRGWWADIIEVVLGDRWGSKLWTLERGKVLNAILPTTKVRAEQALSWLVEDGVAEKVEVETSFTTEKVIKIKIDISRPTGETNIFSVFWDGQKMKRG